MNLRKLRKAAGASTVDGSVKRVASLPAGEPQKPDAPPALKVEPLSSHAGGRDAARAAFVADAGGPPPPPPASPASPGESAPPPAQASPPAAGGAPPAAGTAPTGEQLTVEQVAEFGVRILDTVAQQFGPRIGGEPHNWAQTDDERAMLTHGATPLAAKWFATDKPTPEAMFVVCLAAVYGPRVVAARAEAKKRHGSVHERPAAPPPPPATSSNGAPVATSEAAPAPAAPVAARARANVDGIFG